MTGATVKLGLQGPTKTGDIITATLPAGATAANFSTSGATVRAFGSNYPAVLTFGTSTVSLPWPAPMASGSQPAILQLQNAAVSVNGASLALASAVSTLLTTASPGAIVVALTDPYAGLGLGTTTYSSFNAAPQLAVASTGITAGLSAAVAGTSYSIGVEATSGDGKRKTGETFTFLGALGLGTLVFSGGFTVGTDVGLGTLTGATAGSAIGGVTGVVFAGNGTSRTYTGTPTVAGQSPVETLAGVSGSPKTSAVVVAPASAGTAVVTRTNQMTTFGTSTMAASGNLDTTDASTPAGTVPAQYVGHTIQGQIRSLTSVAPTITNAAVADVTPTSVTQTIRDYAAAGSVAGQDVMYQIGGNFTGNDWDLWAGTDHNRSLDTGSVAVVEAAITGAAQPGNGNIYHLIAGSGNLSPQLAPLGIFYRHQKRLKVNINHKVGAGRIDDAYLAWHGYPDAPETAADIELVRKRQRPNTIGAGTTPLHCNGIGYTQIGTIAVPAVDAWYAGPPYVQQHDYFARISTGTGFIDNLRYMGSLAGCTFSCSDARFAVAVSGSNLQLSLVGARPTAGFTQMNITVSKATFADRVFPIRVSVSGRDASAPALPGKVRLNGFVQAILEGSKVPYAAMRKFTAVIAVGVEADNGDDPNFPAGSSDTRQMYLVSATNSILVQRNTSGTLQFSGLDSTGAINFSSGAAPGLTLRAANGTRYLFIQYDIDAGISRHYLTAGIGVAAHALTNMSAAVGTGTIGAVPTAGQLNLFADNTNPPKSWHGPVGLIWFAAVGAAELDISDPTKRALFCTETAAEPTPVALPHNGVVAGVTPFLCIKGDAAEYMMGGMEDPTNYDAPAGGGNMLNNGTAGNLLLYVNGTPADRVGNLANA